MQLLEACIFSDFTHMKLHCYLVLGSLFRLLVYCFFDQLCAILKELHTAFNCGKTFVIKLPS